MMGFDPKKIAEMITESPDGTVGGPGVVEMVTGAVIDFVKHIDMGHYFVVFVKPRGEPRSRMTKYVSSASGRWAGERGMLKNNLWPSPNSPVPAGQPGAFGEALLTFPLDVLPIAKGRIVKISMRR